MNHLVGGRGEACDTLPSKKWKKDFNKNIFMTTGQNSDHDAAWKQEKPELKVWNT